jgi:hypothetical protein
MSENQEYSSTSLTYVLGSTFHENHGNKLFAAKTENECAEILATKIKSLQKYKIENIWIRLNDVLDSEYEASRVLGFGADQFRDMLLTLKVLQDGKYYVNNLVTALRRHGIEVERAFYKLMTPGDRRLDLKHVRFGFVNSPRDAKYQSLQPNAISAECMYEFMMLRNGPPKVGNLMEPGAYTHDAIQDSGDDAIQDSGDEPCSDSDPDDGNLQNVANRPEGEMCKTCLKFVQGNNIIETKYNNCKKCLCLRCPSVKTYRSLKQNLPNADLKRVVHHIGSGDENNGIALLVRRLYELNPQAAAQGLREAGCHFRAGRLLLEDSLMYMSVLNLSANQYKDLSALLKFHLGYNVLATHAGMQQSTNIYGTDLQWRLYAGVQVRPDHFDPPSCDYWFKDISTVLTNRLRLDRDFGMPRPSGISSIQWLSPVEANRSTYISIVISCDGGGGSFKVAATTAVRAIDQCKHLEQIGWANCSENHQMLSVALLPEINRGLEEIKKKSVLFAWSPANNKWDFVLIPEEMTVCEKEQLRCREAPSSVYYRYESPSDPGRYKDITFEKLTPEDCLGDLHTEIIPIKLRLVCDLKCMCILQNRPNLSSTQCPFCDLGASDWEPTHERSIPQAMFTSADLKCWNDREKSICRYSRAQFKPKVELLLSAIPLEDRCIPRLHLEIGLITYIYHAILTFGMEKVENNVQFRIQYYEGLEKRIEHNKQALQDQINAITSAVTYDAVADPALHAEYQEYKAEYSEHGKNLDTTKFNQFSSRPTFKQMEKINNVSMKIQLEELLQLETKSLEDMQRKLNDCRQKQAQKAPKNDAKKTSEIRSKLEKLFSSYGVDAQAYHGEALVGNHTKKFLAKNKEILDSVFAIYRKKIEEQHQSEQALQARPTRQSSITMSNAQSEPEHGSTQQGIKEKRLQEIKQFCDKMYVLTSALDVLFSALSCFENLEASDILELQKLQLLVGKMWREMNLGARKPKLHILEAHTSHFIQTHGPLGFVTEEGIEHLHAQRNRMYRVFGSIRDVQRKETLVQNRVNQLALSEPRDSLFQAQRKRMPAEDSIPINAKKSALSARQDQKKIKLEDIHNHPAYKSISTNMHTHGSA